MRGPLWRTWSSGWFPLNSCWCLAERDHLLSLYATSFFLLIKPQLCYQLIWWCGLNYGLLLMGPGRGLSPQTWRTPVLSVWCWRCDSLSWLTGVSQSKNSSIQLQRDVFRPSRIQLPTDAEEWCCWMLNWSLWTAFLHKCSFVQVGEGQVQDDGNGIIH